MTVIGNIIVFFFIFQALFFISPVSTKENKYSKEANTNNNDKEYKDNISKYVDLDKPFRMGKVNIIWEKAKKRLSEAKLKTLYSDLHMQDKEEMNLKRVKSNGQDKDGILEANVRRKLKGIINTYALGDSFQEHVDEDSSKRHSDNAINKSLFKDKKLNKLWEKAQSSSFNERELKILKEEFAHHQQKLEEYFTLKEALKSEVEDDQNLKENSIHQVIDDSEDVRPKDKKNDPHEKNQLGKKYKELKENYDYLLKKATNGPSHIEFSQPKVNNLWKMALKSDFNPEELSSLQEELRHLERRLEKLQHLQGEILLKQDHSPKEIDNSQKDTDSLFMDKIKKHERHVEKLHNELERRILNRHTEL